MNAYRDDMDFFVSRQETDGTSALKQEVLYRAPAAHVSAQRQTVHIKPAPKAAPRAIPAHILVFLAVIFFGTVSSLIVLLTGGGQIHTIGNQCAGLRNQYAVLQSEASSLEEQYSARLDDRDRIINYAYNNLGMVSETNARICYMRIPAEVRLPEVTVTGGNESVFSIIKDILGL